MRNTQLVAAIAAMAFISAAAARSQTDTSLKLTTKAPAAAAEFRAGVSDYQNLSFESAAAHFKAAIDADPGFGLARVLYAGTTFGLDQSQLESELSRGVAAARRQVELNPSAPNPHDTYAEILQWNGNLAEAAAHYKQATTLTPRFPEAYAGLAEVATLQGQYDQARSYLNQAMANAWTPQQ